jgi:hypothetical protein
VLRDDNFATFACARCLEILGSSTSGPVQVCIGRALPLISSESSVSRPRVYLPYVTQTEDSGGGASGVCSHGSQRAIIRIQDKRKCKAIQNAL